MKIGIIADVFSTKQLPSVGVLYTNILEELYHLDKNIQIFAISYEEIEHDCLAER